MWTRLLPVLPCILLAVSAEAQSFDLSWHTVDTGGGESTGGGFVLHATVGQSDSGERPATGGPYSLSGGFWLAMDIDSAGEIFSDGFESGDLSAWSTVVGTKGDAKQSPRRDVPPAARHNE